MTLPRAANVRPRAPHIGTVGCGLPHRPVALPTHIGTVGCGLPHRPVALPTVVRQGAPYMPLLRGAVFHNVGIMDAAVGIRPGPNIVTGGTHGRHAGERARQVSDSRCDWQADDSASCGESADLMPPGPHALEPWVGGRSSDQRPATSDQ
jgi:hypothetical protein